MSASPIDATALNLSLLNRCFRRVPIAVAVARMTTVNPAVTNSLPRSEATAVYR